MVHSSQGENGPTTARTRVPPEKQPLRPAIALALIALVTLLLELAGLALTLVLAESGLFQGEFWDLDLEEQEFAVRVLALVLGILAFVVVGLGLKVASLVLGILVVVRGDGKLRIGGSLLLAIALLGLFFSLSVELPSLSGSIGTVLVVLQWAAEILRWALMIAGVVLLGLGIREVRRARAAQSPGLR